MANARYAAMNEVIGEPEHDANSALTELDKGKVDSFQSNSKILTMSLCFICLV